VVDKSGRSISVGSFGTFWTITFEKNVLLDHKNTDFESICEVARNSPEGAKSIESGALLNLIQSIKDPVTISQTLMHRSRLLAMSHF